MQNNLPINVILVLWYDIKTVAAMEGWGSFSNVYYVQYALYKTRSKRMTKRQQV